ncbi:hypothetical protein ACHAC9_00765 [Massilia sp. CMS3.1]|uniref:hypothetical protein n=1 Tax=Massilia sp. CMS3.1 TaxID=3373083 RepID=UPI003EE69CBD
MFGSGILETIIGLIFVFLLVSMLVTIMNEMIAAALASRAKWLRLGIDRLLGSTWAKQLYAHPLVEGTARNGKDFAAGRNGPSYIPSRSFANVLMRIIEQNSQGFTACTQTLRSAFDAASSAGSTIESLRTHMSAAAAEMRASGGVGVAAAGDLDRRLESLHAPNTRQWLGELDTRLDEIGRAARPEFAPLLQTLGTLVADGIHAQAGIEELRTRFNDAVTNLLTGPATQVLKDELTVMGKRLQGPYTVGDAYADMQWWIGGFSARYVRQMIEALPEDPSGRMRSLLLTLFDDAKNDVDKFKENIEIWFNNGMDRVNGWYKRRSQWVIAGLALGTAVAMNVDAILLFKHLQKYPASRDAIVAQARLFVEKNPAPPQTGPTINFGSQFSGYLTLKKAGTPKSVTVTSENRALKGLPIVVAVAPDATKVPFTVDTDFADKQGTAVIKSADNSTDEVTLTLAPSLPTQFYAAREQLESLAIPVGWVSKGNRSEVENGQVLPGFLDIAGCFRLAWQHGLGWLLTAIAATLGAPFWFDMLNRIISIRAAGKAPEEEPKPPKSVSVPVEPGQSQQEADRTRHEHFQRR